MVDAAAIQKISDEIAQRFQPERIILFGSYAYGSPNDDSDVDILVILSFEGSIKDKMFEIQKFIQSPFSMDLIVTTPPLLQRRLEMEDYFLQEITQKGRALYEASDSGVAQ